MKTVGYAIVGTGYFGAELGRIMKEQEGAKIVAVLDPENGQTIADELGCDVETDLDTYDMSQIISNIGVKDSVVLPQSEIMEWQQNQA